MFCPFFHLRQGRPDPLLRQFRRNTWHRSELSGDLVSRPAFAGDHDTLEPARFDEFAQSFVRFAPATFLFPVNIDFGGVGLWPNKSDVAPDLHNDGVNEESRVLTRAVNPLPRGERGSEARRRLDNLERLGKQKAAAEPDVAAAKERVVEAESFGGGAAVGALRAVGIHFFDGDPACGAVEEDGVEAGLFAVGEMGVAVGVSRVAGFDGHGAGEERGGVAVTRGGGVDHGPVGAFVPIGFDVIEAGRAEAVIPAGVAHFVLHAVGVGVDVEVVRVADVGAPVVAVESAGEGSPDGGEAGGAAVPVPVDGVVGAGDAGAPEEFGGGDVTAVDEDAGREDGAVVVLPEEADAVLAAGLEVGGVAVAEVFPVEDGAGEVEPVVVGVRDGRDAELSLVGRTDDAFGGFLRARNRGEQHRDQHREDGDDGEQFHERKSAANGRERRTHRVTPAWLERPAINFPDARR